ncbi:GntR family transcriptional regulator [Nonomuraea sediminis]|uniref:GntR family transcriptional regulator n=1 Tax=Nonomuraea sediminis TaxID=2835864 RepID=UPI001BDBFE87|nr:GntR family transcriptional regulator [Nonomuraea sediminis]
MSIPEQDRPLPAEGEPVDTPGLSLDQLAYEWVRERIIDGTYKPGARIRERTVAEELGISRIPIREAFPRLESEGFIRSVPRRGAVVTSLTVRDVNELYDVRCSLEVLATRLAAERCSLGASAEVLRELLDEAESAVAANDGALLSATNSRFHAAILTLSDNQLLQDLMAPILGRVNRLFYIVPESNQVNFHHEHAELYRAISSGQAELAAALAFAHVEHSRRDTLPIVQSLLDEAQTPRPTGARHMIKRTP